MLSKRKLLSQIFQIFGPYNGKMDTANTSLGNSDVPLTWAEPGRVPVTGPAIHASTGPATAVACLVHTLICIRRQLSAKCWPVFTWNISLCQSGICLKAEVPLAPVSQSIVSKYQSNILYLNGVNMFTRFRGVLWLLCTDCLPLKEQHLSTLTSLFFSSHSSILSIIQLYCHGGPECS